MFPAHMRTTQATLAFIPPRTPPLLCSSAIPILGTTGAFQTSVQCPPAAAAPLTSQLQALGGSQSMVTDLVANQLGAAPSPPLDPNVQQPPSTGSSGNVAYAMQAPAANPVTQIPTNTAVALPPTQPAINRSAPPTPIPAKTLDNTSLPSPAPAQSLVTSVATGQVPPPSPPAAAAAYPAPPAASPTPTAVPAATAASLTDSSGGSATLGIATGAAAGAVALAGTGAIAFVVARRRRRRAAKRTVGWRDVESDLTFQVGGAGPRGETADCLHT